MGNRGVSVGDFGITGVVRVTARVDVGRDGVVAGLRPRKSSAATVGHRRGSAPRGTWDSRAPPTWHLSVNWAVSIRMA